MTFMEELSLVISQPDEGNSFKKSVGTKNRL